ncbi:type I secretion system permease/ATPase [Balneatrix alpica]|uniref:Type I secretion system permease/ATPase n=1 Tax=Balneatrix alpica TaxID=75684 RepID=A0ABV5ZF17_9GAMM|nr:type I secretion system permease/ATPase [Balneatrix alpica]
MAKLKNVQKNDLRNALSLCKGSFIVAGIFSFFINVLMLVPSIYMLQVYDRVVTSGSESTLFFISLIAFFAFVVMGGLEWVRSQILVRVSNRIDYLVSDRIYDVCFKRSLVSQGNSASAQPLTDLTALRQFMTGNGLFAVFDAPWLPIYIFVMFAFHQWFGWMAVFSAVILLLIAYANDKTTNNAITEANKISNENISKTNRQLFNAEVIAALGMITALKKRWRKSNEDVLLLQSNASMQASLMTNISKVFRMIMQSATLGVGAYLVLENQMSPGMMIAGSILLSRALSPIDLLVGSWKGFINAKGQYDRLNEILENMPKETEKMSLPAPKGEINFEQAFVTPPGSRMPVIKGINLHIPAGQIVGIIGPSGAGKTTLARALLGIWPCSQGCIRLDGADIFHWSRDEIGSHIGYLPQDIELFEGTISENISRFADQPKSEDVIAAAQLAGVHDMILQLPQGYDTHIGQAAGVLSGGQRQRLGLARALYGMPSLIVLDEPNSNLDDEGEKALFKSLQELKKAAKTVFVISHRSSLLAYVDSLILLRDGSVSMAGPRDMVLQKLAESKHSSVGKANG